MPWPPQSPDMNPVETAWAMLVKVMRKKQFNSKEEAWSTIKQTWDDTPQSYFAGDTVFVCFALSLWFQAWLKACLEGYML